MDFKLVCDYVPQGDQPQAIDHLIRGIEEGLDHQLPVAVADDLGRRQYRTGFLSQTQRQFGGLLSHKQSAAARELFEETGVLIARRADGSYPSSGQELDNFRHELLADSGWDVKGYTPKVEAALPPAYKLDSKGKVQRRV